MPSLSYYRRVFAAYLGGAKSQLSFWHEQPAVNEQAFGADPLPYYMTFAEKARYSGPFDENGVPLLDYHGRIGNQHNPIAIAQFGLASLNSGNEAGARICADWLVEKLKPNAKGIPVWMHEFNWEYFRPLRAPWYSGLAQGQGVSLLLRAARASGESRYLDTARRAATALLTPIEQGGVLHMDDKGDGWIEEYIVEPPTHILNGFFWALWGVWDLLKLDEAHRDRPQFEELWNRSLTTLEKNLSRFDCGYWSLYDLAPLPRANVASSFYHRLHIVQLDVMHRLSGRAVFKTWHDQWAGYLQSPRNRRRAWMAKALFKLRHY
jgi:hypothetical protein